MKRTIENPDARNKTVLVRADLNVPLDDGYVADDTRIRDVLPTRKYLATQDAKIAVCSHLGRPEGEVREELRLRPVAVCLKNRLSQTVRTWDDCVGEKVAALVHQPAPGEIILLERKAKKVVWSGPVGCAELDAFAGGTVELGQSLAGLDAQTIVGGGDTVAALKRLGWLDQISHASTGGGAFLKLLDGGRLPALEALEEHS